MDLNYKAGGVINIIHIFGNMIILAGKFNYIYFISDVLEKKYMLDKGLEPLKITRDNKNKFLVCFTNGLLLSFKIEFTEGDIEIIETSKMFTDLKCIRSMVYDNFLEAHYIASRKRITMWNKKIDYVLDFPDIKGLPVSIAVDKDLCRLYSVNNNGIVQIWNTEKVTLINFINTNNTLIKDIIIHGDRILIMSMDGKIRFYEKKTYYNYHTLNIGAACSCMCIYRNYLVVSTEFLIKFYSIYSVELVKCNMTSGLSIARCLVSDKNNIYTSDSNILNILN